MKKFVVTDPCYILPDEVWDKCCKVFDEYDNDEFMYQRFDEAVTKALTEFTGTKAYACGTGYGDWHNQLEGDGHILHDEFCADAGMVCVCEMTENVEKALKDCGDWAYAVFECEELENVILDLENPNWTRVFIETTEGHYFYTLKMEENDDDDYEDEESCYW